MEHQDCRYCAQVLRQTLPGCAANTLSIDRNGKVRLHDRLPHVGPNACPDCGVPRFACHHAGCSHDLCPRCGESLSACSCRVVSSGYLPNVHTFEQSNLI